MSQNLKVLICLLVACALMAGSPALAGEPEMQTEAVGECKLADLERTTEGWFQAWSLSLALSGNPEMQNKAVGECKFADLECPNDWAPVSCKKGGWFANRCYAKRACAKACRNFFGG